MEIVIMARTKSGELAPYVKLLALLQDGNVVTKDDIDAKLGKDIHVYRLSTYVWEIKSKTPGVVKVIKDGKAVSGYQITNPAEVKTFLASQTGISNFVPGTGNVTPSNSKFANKPVKSLSSLKAKPAKTKVTKPAKVEAPVVEDEVTEITE
jgi:hypothetical protein